jgi:hypothetical protein
MTKFWVSSDLFATVSIYLDKVKIELNEQTYLFWYNRRVFIIFEVRVFEGGKVAFFCIFAKKVYFEYVIS